MPFRASRRVLTAACLLGCGLIAPAAAQAAGCSPSACLPKTGTYSGPNPQGLKSSLGPTTITMKVAYRKAGKKVKSSYGNSLEEASSYLRYTCASKTNPWVEVGAALPALQPVKIKADGKARVVVPAQFSAGVHTWTFRFKRDSVTGHVSGTYTSSEGEACKVSVDFRAKLKR